MSFLYVCFRMRSSFFLKNSVFPLVRTTSDGFLYFLFFWKCVYFTFILKGIFTGFRIIEHQEWGGFRPFKRWHSTVSWLLSFHSDFLLFMWRNCYLHSIWFFYGFLLTILSLYIVFSFLPFSAFLICPNLVFFTPFYLSLFPKSDYYFCIFFWIIILLQFS